jgi:hypothetical protein
MQHLNTCRLFQQEQTTTLPQNTQEIPDLMPTPQEDEAIRLLAQFVEDLWEFYLLLLLYNTVIYYLFCYAD